MTQTAILGAAWSDYEEDHQGTTLILEYDLAPSEPSSRNCALIPLQVLTEFCMAEQDGDFWALSAQTVARLTAWYA